MKDIKVRRELFWDMDFDAMDENIHRVHIVQQVLNLGTPEEFREIMRYYGRGGGRRVEHREKSVEHRA